MNRKIMMLCIMVAFCFIMAGSNSAFTANVAMTGEQSMQKPFAFSVTQQVLKLNFLGQNFEIMYPRDELVLVAHKVASCIKEIMVKVGQNTEHIIEQDFLR